MKILSNLSKVVNTIKNSISQYPKVFYARHIGEGVVLYKNADGGDDLYLVSNDTLKKMNPSFEGKPVYVQHQDVSMEEMKDKAVGYVVKSFYLPEDGKHWLEMLITDDEGFRAINEGYKVSNCYNVAELTEGGVWHNIPYAKEIKGGEYEHLALVNNPRYEEALILSADDFKKYKEEKKKELVELQNSTEFKESEHPRKADGKFAPKGEGEAKKAEVGTRVKHKTFGEGKISGIYGDKITFAFDSEDAKVVKDLLKEVKENSKEERNKMFGFKKNEEEKEVKEIKEIEKTSETPAEKVEEKEVAEVGEVEKENSTAEELRSFLMEKGLLEDEVNEIFSKIAKLVEETKTPEEESEVETEKNDKDLVEEKPETLETEEVKEVKEDVENEETEEETEDKEKAEVEVSEDTKNANADDEDKEICNSKEGKNFDRLMNANGVAKEKAIVINSLEMRLQKGKELYGSK